MRRRILNQNNRIGGGGVKFIKSLRVPINKTENRDHIFFLSSVDGSYLSGISETISKNNFKFICNSFKSNEYSYIIKPEIRDKYSIRITLDGPELNDSNGGKVALIYEFSINDLVIPLLLFNGKQCHPAQFANTLAQLGYNALDDSSSDTDTTRLYLYI